MTAGKTAIYTYNQMESLMDNLTKYFVTNSNRTPPVTNARYALSAEDAVISESKLYESDDLTLTVREAGEKGSQKFRVRCAMSFDVEKIEEPAAV